MKTIDIPYQDLTVKPFVLTFEKIKIEYFLFIKFVWKIKKSGGRNWQHIIFNLITIFLISPVALGLDFTLLLFVGIFKVSKWLGLEIIDLLKYTGKKSIDVILKKFAGTIIIILIFIISVIVIYYRFEVIKTLILNLFDKYI